MKLLLHTCCGPCTKGTLKAIDRNEIDVTAYWYNPNIHPYLEYQSRLDSLKKLAQSVDMDAIIEDDYGLKRFVQMVADDLEFGKRCIKCYTDRIYQTARKAKELGYDAFSTTLLVSPYQQHERIKQEATRIAEEIGVPFYYIDPRPYFREGNKEAREQGLYMQKYCGCVFSEEDRYKKQTK
ncbi:MAG: epoxyqueuosine reductase QueH [Bacilli bacterium]|nr:epoxyqueuosine reductase QueH [Bacilli bacterium]MBN2877432.1 epoxyqueuosine reductase QueH [Bacilli bacterium]